MNKRKFTNNEKEEGENKKLKYTVNTISDLINMCDHKYKFNRTDINNLLYIKDDLIEIDKMVGLEDLKKQLAQMILYTIQYPYDNDMLHICINAEPGAGKTTVSKIIANIMLKLKDWDTNKFFIGTRTDLVASYVGQSGAKTQRLIDRASYGVLFIDEVYSLASADSYSDEVINCLVHNLSEKKNWVCIIAGYPHENKLFFDMNKGLERRFPWKFDIKPYTKEELIDIFLYQIKQDEWKYEDDIKHALNKIISVDDFPNMGGSTANLLMHCKCAHSKRVFGGKKKIKRMLCPDDILNGFELYKQNIKNNDDKKLREDIRARLYT